jgi:hypothetical protein
MSDEKTPEKGLTSSEGQSQRRRNQRAEPSNEAQDRSAKLRPRRAQATAKERANQRRPRGMRGAEPRNEEQNRSVKLRSRRAQATTKAGANQRRPRGRCRAELSPEELDRVEAAAMASTNQ